MAWKKKILAHDSLKKIYFGPESDRKKYSGQTEKPRPPPGSLMVAPLKRKTHPAFRVLNVFYFQTDFNLRFKRKRDVRLTCHRVWCILHRILLTQMAMPLASHIIVQMELTSFFGN